MSFDPYRLPRTVTPSRYDLELEPDLGAATFRGTVAITLDVHEATTELVGNAIELEHRRGLGGAARRAAPRRDDHPRRGHRALHRHHGRAASPPARRRSTSPSAARSTTSCAASTAPHSRDDRRPRAGDRHHPDAGHRLPARLPVLGRARPQGGLRRHAGGAPTTCSPSPTAPRSGESQPRTARSRITFADTMPMSTYLVAFVVGPLEATDPIDVDGTPLRVVHVPGKGHLAGFALEIGAFALRWFQQYYAHPLPGREGRPRRPARLRRRGDGEPRVHHVPRDGPARRPRHRHPAAKSSASPTWWPTSWPTCGSATSSRCAGGTASGSTRRSPRSWRWPRATPSARRGSAGRASASSARPPSRRTRWPPPARSSTRCASPGRRRGHVRRAHLREGRGAAAHAGAVPGRGALPRRHPPLPRPSTATRTPRRATCGTPSRPTTGEPVRRIMDTLDLAGRLPARLGRRRRRHARRADAAPVPVRRRRRRHPLGHPGDRAPASR